MVNMTNITMTKQNTPNKEGLSIFFTWWVLVWVWGFDGRLSVYTMHLPRDPDCLSVCVRLFCFFSLCMRACAWVRACTWQKTKCRQPHRKHTRHEYPIILTGSCKHTHVNKEWSVDCSCSWICLSTCLTSLGATRQIRGDWEQSVCCSGLYWSSYNQPTGPSTTAFLIQVVGAILQEHLFSHVLV